MYAVNPNWAMFLEFVNRNGSGLAFWSIFMTVLAIGGTSILIHLHKEGKIVPPEPEKERMFFVTLGEEEVFRCLAYDVDVASGEGIPFLNFLGPVYGDDSRVTVAIYPWREDMKVLSEPKRETQGN